MKLTPFQLGQDAAIVERITALTAREPPVKVSGFMNIAIALAQFIMLALATMASHILVNSGSIDTDNLTWSGHITLFIARQGLWLLIIPAAWLLFAGWCEKTKSPLAKVAQPLGVGIAVLILLAIVLVLAF